MHQLASNAPFQMQISHYCRLVGKEDNESLKKIIPKFLNYLLFIFASEKSHDVEDIVQTSNEGNTVYLAIAGLCQGFCRMLSTQYHRYQTLNIKF